MIVFDDKKTIIWIFVFILFILWIVFFPIPAIVFPK